MTSNILITGANGQLGNELKVLAHALPGFDFIYGDLPDLDITQSDSINRFLKARNVGHIVNCAAYTQVDKAESESEIAYAVNAKGAGLLAKIAQENDARLLHISTDFVFDGGKSTPYKPDDKANPLGIYGKSKLQGENEVLVACEKAVVIRTSWLHSSYGNNFVKSMLRLGAQRSQLGVVYDQVGAPTYAADLAAAIIQIIRQANKGNGQIFHFSNAGVASWYDFAHAIMQMAGLPCKVSPIETHEYPTPAPRPAYSVMHCRKIQAHFEGIDLPHWRSSLKRCLSKIGLPA